MKEIELEKILKALANRRRLAILKTIKHKKRVSVSNIAEGIKLSIRSTSKHLAILYAAGLVAKEQNHFYVDYSLAPANDKVSVYIIANL
jgi:DNA-binding transcriptional ArsR family regulator